MENANEPATLSDLSLIAALCTTQEDDDALYAEFVNRFLPEVKEQCLIKCEKRGMDRQIGEQIAHETFENLRRYKSFRSDRINIQNDHRAIVAYLLRISGRLFIDHYNEQKRVNTVKTDKSIFYNIGVERQNVQTAEELNETRDRTLRALKGLSEREKAVLLADMEYKRYSNYLPEAVTEALAARFNIKKDTIRKIRERALTKVKNAINEFNGK